MAKTSNTFKGFSEEYIQNKNECYDYDEHTIECYDYNCDRELIECICDKSKSSATKSERMDSPRDNGQEKDKALAYDVRAESNKRVFASSPAQNLIKTSEEIECELYSSEKSFGIESELYMRDRDKQWIPLLEYDKLNACRKGDAEASELIILELKQQIKDLESKSQTLLLGKGTMTGEQLKRIADKIKKDLIKDVEKLTDWVIEQGCNDIMRMHLFKQKIKELK